MTLREFIDWIVKQIATFAVNLSKVADKPQSRKAWMQTFLDWMEWGTEMQDEYWPDESDVGR
jgi:hypothetical protein